MHYWLKIALTLCPLVAVALLNSSNVQAEDRRPWAQRDQYPPSGYSYQAESFYVVPPYVGLGSSVFIPPPVVLSRQPAFPSSAVYIEPFPGAGFNHQSGFRQQPRVDLPPAPAGMGFSTGPRSARGIRPEVRSVNSFRGPFRPRASFDPAVDGHYRRPLSVYQYETQRRLGGPNRFRGGW